jgi:Family of unknown function (DUF6734)
MRATRRLVWSSRKHQLLAWTLSFQTARKHYGKTSLFTDDEGARILIDGIGLEFDTVSVDLNELAHSDPEWWTLGKMMTYRAQAEPFVHIDEDVFLWQRLPRELDVPPSKTHCSWSGSKNASNETIQSHYKRCLSYLRS